jgi:hypothetical protein
MVPLQPGGAPPGGVEHALDVKKDEAAGGDASEGDKGHVEYAEVGYQEIFKQFVVLGWTAFGGPAAHIALFQKVPSTQPPHSGLRRDFRPKVGCLNRRNPPISLRYCLP